MKKFVVALVVGVASAASASSPATIPDAAEAGNRNAVVAMLARGADVNVAGPDGTTAIMWAASNDDVELVRALIKAGANVNAKNKFGTSALTEASIIGSAPIINAL